MPFDGIFCHFPTEDPLEESRLVSECRRMREILDAMTGESLLLMDESFSGTSASEGAVIALEVLKTIQARRTCCFFATHLHEVAGNISLLNQKRACVKNLSAEYRAGERTFKIVEAVPGGKSYGYEIAEKYGLAFVEE